MPPKKIAVDGVGRVKLSNDKELDKWLIKKEVDGLVDSEGCEVGGFESLVDDGKYTLTMASKKMTVEDASGTVRTIQVTEGNVEIWLDKLVSSSFVSSDSVEIIDFESLVDGGKCTLGPPQLKQQLQQDGELRCCSRSHFCIQILLRILIDSFTNSIEIESPACRKRTPQSGEGGRVERVLKRRIISFCRDRSASGE
jgi:hypothetical protein